MNKTILISCPKHDMTTEYLYHWSEKIVKTANKKGIKVLHKDGRKKEILNIITKIRPSYIIFNGHGSDDSILGHNNEVLIHAGENDEILKSKIVYSISCSSAKKLGPSSIKSGTISFIGYEDLFVFPFDPSKTCNPKKDKVAKPFLESANQFSLSLIKGNNVKTSYERSQDSFKKWIEYYQRSDAPPEAETILPWLVWDMYIQRVHGNNSASF